MFKSNKLLLLELQEPENHSKFEFLVPRRDEPAQREPSHSEMARRRQTEPQTTVRALVAGTAAHFHGLLQPPCHLKALERKCCTDISLRPFLLLLFSPHWQKSQALSQVERSYPTYADSKLLTSITNCVGLAASAVARSDSSTALPVQPPAATAVLR